MTDNKQERFNDLMLKLIRKTMSECFKETFGFEPQRPPTMNAVREMATYVTEKYGVPTNSVELRDWIRKGWKDYMKSKGPGG